MPVLKVGDRVRVVKRTGWPKWARQRMPGKLGTVSRVAAWPTLAMYTVEFDEPISDRSFIYSRWTFDTPDLEKVS